MKYLVDDQTAEVKAAFEFPLDSSIAGHFVVDVPTDLGVKPSGSTVAGLISAKSAALQAAHPTLATVSLDEFLDTSGVDTNPSLTTRVLLGPNKRVALLEGGQLTTTVFQMTGSFTKYFLRLAVFSQFQESQAFGAPYPGPGRVLYGWDNDASRYVEPNPTAISVQLTDSSGFGVYDAPDVNALNSFSSGDLFVRLKLLNTGAQTLYLSDWYMLWG